MAKREVNERWQREMADFFVQPDCILPDRVMGSVGRSVSICSPHFDDGMTPKSCCRSVFLHWLGGLASGSFYVAPIAA